MWSLLGIKPKRDNINPSDICQVPGTESVTEELLSKALRGITHRITMHSSCGTAGRGKKRACLGLQRCAMLQLELSSNHTSSPGAELRQGEELCRSGSEVS